MNNATQSRYGTSLTVSFPDFPSFTESPRSFTLTQESGKHDVAKLNFGSFNTYFYKALKTGVAVHVRWKNEKGVGEFFGYTNDATPTTQGTTRRDLVVTCVGSSFPLKEGGNKHWANKTASDIVTDIAKKFNLKPVVTSHPTRFSHQSLTGHSYWEKVQELAQRVGYVAQVIGTELHFHPMDVMLNKFTTSIPVLSFQDKLIPAGGIWEAQTLDMFKPTLGDHVERGNHTRKSKTVSGIHPVTGKLFSSTSSPGKVGTNLRKNTVDPIFSQIIPTHITDTPEAAKATAEAYAQLARWSIPAKAAAQGDARIAPYRTVEINNTNESTDGYWVVTKAEHTWLFSGVYTVEFSCVTDGLGGNKPTAFRTSKATVTPTRNIEYELAQKVTTKPTPVKLNGTKPLYKQTEASYKVTPRRWVGK